jgi:hypothetical protein
MATTAGMFIAAQADADRDFVALERCAPFDVSRWRRCGSRTTP